MRSRVFVCALLQAKHVRVDTNVDRTHQRLVKTVRRANIMWCDCVFVHFCAFFSRLCAQLHIKLYWWIVSTFNKIVLSPNIYLPQSFNSSLWLCSSYARTQNLSERMNARNKIINPVFVDTVHYSWIVLVIIIISLSIIFAQVLIHFQVCFVRLVYYNDRQNSHSSNRCIEIVLFGYLF